VLLRRFDVTNCHGAVLDAHFVLCEIGGRSRAVTAQLCVCMYADRNQGAEYASDLAESCRQVRTYVTNLETEMKERAALIEMLQQSELYYDAQASEANTVAMVSHSAVLLMAVLVGSYCLCYRLLHC